MTGPRSRPRPLALSLLVALLVLPARSILAGDGAIPEGGAMTKILVEAKGIARVTSADLLAAGSPLAPADPSRLRLRRRDTVVPILIEPLRTGDPGGRFAISFLAEPPHGDSTWENPYSRFAAYRLEEAPAGEAVDPRIALAPAPSAKGAKKARRSSPVTVHHEQNLQLIRFSGGQEPPETWFWKQIRATDAAETTVTIPAESIDSHGGGWLRVGLQGYSHLPENPDHSVEIGWNGRPLGVARWDDATPFVFESRLAAGAIVDGENRLSLRALGDRTRGIDLVLLDWVELVEPRLHRLGPAGQAELVAGPAAPVRIEGTDAPLRAFDLENPRAAEIRAAARRGEPRNFAPAAGPKGASRWLLAAAGTGTVATRVEVSRPAELRSEGLGADFVIVSHRNLLGASNRLAAARRQEGLRTEVVAVDDVYDRFGDGTVEPRAIREFLRHAWARWRPRPSYVLLMGDASWDFRNENVTDENYADWHWDASWPEAPPKNSSTPFHSKPNPDGSYPNDRRLVPTMQYQSYWGHAASDHLFGCVAGGDDVADIAVGRIPAGTPEEADAAVDKILAYDALPAASLGSGLFITNDETGAQIETDRLGMAAERLGYRIDKVYPRPEEPDNLENTARIIDLWNAGPAIVLFHGHGGRYIWRTGPPDFRKNHDLFTLADLERLSPTPRIPLVLSLTCYSAPFDHPVADSIGEKLIRMAGRGAVSVIASSWRNAPPVEFAKRLLECLATPGTRRIGDAFRAAMAVENDAVSRNTYNLLGDPTTIYRGQGDLPAASDRAAGEMH